MRVESVKRPTETMDDILQGLGEPQGANSAESPSESAPPSAPDAPDLFDSSAGASPETGTDLNTESPDSSLNPEEKAEDEMTEDEVRELANNPLTPRPVRERLEKGLQYAERFKTEKQAIEAELQELNQKYLSFEGKEALPPPEIERLRKAEQALFEVQSFSATPDTIDKFLRESNPTVYKDYQNQTILNALYKEDGAPDLDNWQFLIDKGLGIDPNDKSAQRVFAADVISAAQALHSGRITKADLHNFSSDEEFEAFERQSKAEAEFRQQAEAHKEAVRFQEAQIRSNEVQSVRENIRSEIVPQIHSSLAKFKLSPIEGEPKVATEFKQEIQNKLNNLFNQATQEIRGLSEIQKAVEIVSKARGVTPQEAVAEVRALMQHPAYKTHLASGITELMDRIDKTLAQEAYRYKLMMMGYEQEATKGQKAREVIGKPNQSANLPGYSEEQLKNMSADERNHYNKVQLTNQLRAQRADRLGN